MTTCGAGINKLAEQARRIALCLCHSADYPATFDAAIVHEAQDAPQLSSWLAAAARWETGDVSPLQCRAWLPICFQRLTRHAQLSPRLPCRQSRRRAETRGRRPVAAPSRPEGQVVLVHRHPRRRRRVLADRGLRDEDGGIRKRHRTALGANGPSADAV